MVSPVSHPASDCLVRTTSRLLIPMHPLTPLRSRAAALLALATAALIPTARAQLIWSVFNETTTVAAPASTATSGVAVPVPAGQRVTLVANNLVPIDLARRVLN